MLNESVLNILSNMLINKDSNTSAAKNYNTAPKSNDLNNMYPYGDFPIRYTKNYQEYLKSNLNRVDTFSTNTDTDNVDSNYQNNTTQNNLDIKTLLPLINALERL